MKTLRTKFKEIALASPEAPPAWIAWALVAVTSAFAWTGVPYLVSFARTLTW
ncbi:hypothetical protein SAMN05192563_10434 [Paraburkholderia aspalathi]|uniref:Uncharacterized protein n=1 Tax=Paraburkholderia aspalathi TaxID=1324617 RepID=A0A1I7EPM3_9BURK|nr:hypothetical protein SAMN05192563_10434 [Paraburkholderia aspalathi]